MTNPAPEKHTFVREGLRSAIVMRARQWPSKNWGNGSRNIICCFTFVKGTRGMSYPELKFNFQSRTLRESEPRTNQGMVLQGQAEGIGYNVSGHYRVAGLVLPPPCREYPAFRLNSPTV